MKIPLLRAFILCFIAHVLCFVEVKAAGLSCAHDDFSQEISLRDTTELLKHEDICYASYGFDNCNLFLRETHRVKIICLSGRTYVDSGSIKSSSRKESFNKAKSFLFQNNFLPFEKPDVRFAEENSEEIKTNTELYKLFYNSRKNIKLENMAVLEKIVASESVGYKPSFTFRLVTQNFTATKVAQDFLDRYEQISSSISLYSYPSESPGVLPLSRSAILMQRK